MLVSSNKMGLERKRRSIAKAISWRILATMVTSLVVFIFTKNFTLALSVGLLEMSAKLIIYYFHERFWTNVSWGIKNPEQKPLKPKIISSN
jgi:adenylylsulfate kinase